MNDTIVDEAVTLLRGQFPCTHLLLLGCCVCVSFESFAQFTFYFGMIKVIKDRFSPENIKRVKKK